MRLPCGIYKELGDKYNQRDILIRLGKLLQENNGDESPDAIKVFEQALSIHKENSKERAETLMLLAEDRSGYCLSLQTMKFCRKSLKIYRVLKDKQGDQDVLEKIITLEWILSNRENPDSSIGQVNALYQIKKDKDQARDLLLTLFRSKSNTKFLDRAISIYENSGDRKGLLETLLIIVELMNRNDSISTLNKALIVSRELRDREKEAKVLYLMSNLCDSLSCKPEKVLDLLNQSLQIYRQLGNRLEEANILSEIAYRNYDMNNLLFDRGATNRYQALNVYQSLNMYQQALNIYTSINDESGKQFALYNIGAIFLSLDRLDQARESFHKALTIGGNPNLEREIVCLLSNTRERLNIEEIYSLNAYFPLSDNYLQFQGQQLCPGGDAGRASNARSRPTVQVVRKKDLLRREN